ncbi:hypothetical protein MYCTH_2112991 [Thermothelomyces thermophilus ATCC 42464]|uniref:AAA+ ATPase domain-containing protein n=1 Tax=Thermothelomyces thermophilus (strain ATCC 42464 / BCRC 31852 / DSM 1799) TaxID=573729 RepID=G2QM31_THET4|nr:uncharacterized protein MYCTH_2112991 [Thermothelomyces thermophilus ATCC 42464]AEO61011.1 hypothetical protein MYCTH_2112991 [Thermothelomyces thermophilus ATCC 42464]
MDLGNLTQGALPASAANTRHEANNSTTSWLPHLPDDVLETLTLLLGPQFNLLLKLLMVLYNIVGGHFGFDPTYPLSAFGFHSLARQYFMASIELIKWFASQPSLVNSRSLTAETVSNSVWDDKDGTGLITKRVSSDGSNAYLNFLTQKTKAAPRFTPALGTHGFWFRGRYFRLHRKQESLYDANRPFGIPQYKDKEIIFLSCFGRSPEPLKELLKHCKEQFYITHQAKTTIRRPAPEAIRKGRRNNWQQVLSDINEYLHPATLRWYANRSIPLRRGYLFYGPPGTGKTLFSFALAGVFGLDIYVISLLDPSLTEEDLLALFTSLPRRCVVLLEDIDTAGLKRTDDPNADEKSSENWKVSDLARELKRHQRGDASENKGISLSGLLNAIDGVASHEGRVLIMTTNKPETLDEALIRPSRIDIQIGFTNATQEQARELFVRMYKPDSTDDPNPFPPVPTPTAPNLNTLAEKFARQIPPGVFSPAELQGFMIKRKGKPKKAADDVGR